MISAREKRPRRALLAWLAALALAIVVVGCSGGNGQGGQAESLTVEQQRGLMERWNAAAAGVTAAGGFDFKWENFDQFPHPTFKGGSEDAYQKFGDILVALYERDDNFQYMSDNRLFRTPLRYVFPSSAPPFETTFEAETNRLLSEGWILSDDTQRKLQDFAARIKNAP